MKKFNSYRGCVENKCEILRQYKFSLCYENMSNVDGYITEKIFDCFEANVIPIYFGAANIEKYIPHNCFIDFRKFSNYHELLDYLKNMNELEYDEIIKNINVYLTTDPFKEFLPSHNSFEIFKHIQTTKSSSNFINFIISFTYIFFIKLFSYLKYKLSNNS